MYRYFCSFLLVLILSACHSEPTTTLTYQVKYQGKVQTCLAPDTQLMWYLSAFASDKAIAIEPIEGHSDKAVLIGADCSTDSWQVQLQQRLNAGQPLSFEIAVPFVENHANPLTALPPLNTSRMFWSWQLGHKFLRFDQANQFSFHLGSTGCTSPSKLRAASQPCQSPNRYRFRLEHYQPNKPIIFDLDKLLAGVDKSKSCMSDKATTSCQQLFSNLTTALFYQD